MGLKTIWIGLDVSKKEFVACTDFPPVDGFHEKKNVEGLSTQTFENSKIGVSKFLRYLDSQSISFENAYRSKFALEEKAELPFSLEPRVLMESTGPYSRNLEGFFLESRPSLRPVIVNAALIASFRTSLNLKNKTDQLDAKAIARYGTERTPEFKIISRKIYAALCELCRFRDFYTVHTTALRNLQGTISEPMLKRMNTATLKHYEKKIDDLERQIKKFIREHEELRREVEIMDSMPGIGVISAATLVAELGSFKDYSTRNKLAAMAGMNPLLCHSGSSIRKSKLSKQGSPLVRKYLYLAAMSAVNRVPELKTFHNRLIAKGKKPMTAQCACMRKILLILRSMVIENRPYQQNFPEK